MIEIVFLEKSYRNYENVPFVKTLAKKAYI